jgi:hypothetical protein
MLKQWRAAASQSKAICDVWNELMQSRELALSELAQDELLIKLGIEQYSTHPVQAAESNSNYSNQQEVEKSMKFFQQRIELSLQKKLELQQSLGQLNLDLDTARHKQEEIAEHFNQAAPGRFVRSVHKCIILLIDTSRWIVSFYSLVEPQLNPQNKPKIVEWIEILAAVQGAIQHLCKLADFYKLTQNKVTELQAFSSSITPKLNKLFAIVPHHYQVPLQYEHIDYCLSSTQNIFCSAHANDSIRPILLDLKQQFNGLLTTLTHTQIRSRYSEILS